MLVADRQAYQELKRRYPPSESPEGDAILGISLGRLGSRASVGWGLAGLY